MQPVARIAVIDTGTRRNRNLQVDQRPGIGDAVINEPKDKFPSSAGTVSGTPGTDQAAEIFRSVAAALGCRRGEGDGGEALGQRSLDYVREWAESAGRLVDPERFESLELLSNSTSEHEVRYDADRGRAVKRTWPGFYGQVPTITNGKLERRNATPEEYLERMALQNETFGSDFRFEGVSVSGKPSLIIGEPAWQPSFVISQEFFETAVAPSETEISAFMEGEGFHAVPGSYWGWWRPADGVAVVDAKSDNFAITENGIEPIDLQMARFLPEEADLEFPV